MTGRELYDMYRDAHGGETGQRPGSFDELNHQQRLVWERLADELYDFWTDRE